VDINIQQVSPGATPSRTGRPRHSATPANGRRDCTLQLLRTAPERVWCPGEIAQALDIAHYRSLCAQMGQWVKEGMLRKAGRGAYTLASAWVGPSQQRPQPGLTSPSTG
jgi:hypothetical protein